MSEISLCCVLALRARDGVGDTVGRDETERGRAHHCSALRTSGLPPSSQLPLVLGGAQLVQRRRCLCRPLRARGDGRVEDGRGDDECGAGEEGWAEGEVEGRDEERDDRRDDDRERRSEALDDIVGVLHHQRDKQPAERDLQDDEAGHPSVALQEAARADGAAVEPRDLAGADEQRQRAELHIPQPDRDLRCPLDDPLQPHAGEAREEARRRDGRHAANRAGRGEGPAGTARRQLHKDDAEEENPQRHPAAEGDVALQQRHREEGCREQLQLVCDLAGSGVEVRRREVEEVVLHEVEQRGHADEESVSPVDEDALPYGIARARDALLQREHRHGDEDLHDLSQEHRRRSEVLWLVRQPRVSHREHLARILHR
mmetsp:Transcript_3301/g.10845  ORF Transcript_3301/g.10845 Transcript_3301/m.10845 type:complete len:372 (-) Transcript_3301:182-1297(-)